MAPYGFKWVEMAPNGSTWIKIAQNGLKWLQMGQNGSKQVKIALNPSKSLQIPTNPSKCLQITRNPSNFFQNAPNYSTSHQENKEKHKDQVGHGFDLWSCLPKKFKDFLKNYPPVKRLIHTHKITKLLIIVWILNTMHPKSTKSQRHTIYSDMNVLIFFVFFEYLQLR